MPVAKVAEGDRRDTAWLRRQAVLAVATITVVALAVAGVFGVRALRARAPFGPDAASVGLRVQLLVAREADAIDVQRRVNARTDTKDLPIHLLGPGARYVVGSIVVHAPAAPPRSVWEVIVIDEQQNTVMPLWASTSGSIGWQGARERQLSDYPWLSAVRPTGTANGVTNSAQAMGFPTATTTPVSFAVAGLPIDGGRAGEDPGFSRTPTTLNDVTIAVLFLSPAGDLWWVKRVNG